MKKSFRATFEKVAFNPKTLLNTIPKASQSIGAAQRASKGAAEAATAAKTVVKTPAPNVTPRTPLSTQHRPNSHAEYLRSIGAIGKTSKNEGNVLKYTPSLGSGKTVRKSQFDSITPVKTPSPGTDRGPLK